MAGLDAFFACLPLLHLGLHLTLWYFVCVFVVLLRACLSVGVLFGVLLVVFVVFVVFVVGRCRSLVRCFPFSRVS